MEVEGTRQRGYPEKTGCDCVRGNTEGFDLSCEDADDRRRSEGFIGDWA